MVFFLGTNIQALGMSSSGGAGTAALYRLSRRLKGVVQSSDRDAHKPQNKSERGLRLALRKPVSLAKTTKPSQAPLMRSHGLGLIQLPWVVGISRERADDCRS